jgi:hypothetical protein
MAEPGWPKSIPESLLGSYSSRQYMDAFPNRKKTHANIFPNAPALRAVLLVTKNSNR